MRRAQILLVVASFSATINAHVPKSIYGKRSPALEVTLASAASGGVAELVATVKNTGTEDLNLVRVGTLLDDVFPVQKVSVTDEVGVEAPLRGIHASIQHDALKPEHFQLLKVSESVKTLIRAATLHEFTKSVTYAFLAAGLIPAAKVGSTELSGPALEFQSNSVKLYVDSEAATAVPMALRASTLEERTNVQDGCNATQLSASTAALINCEKLALAAAADAADLSSARFVEYFKTNSSETRKVVLDRLTAVSGECSTANSGLSRYLCQDTYGICDLDGPLNAYTLWDIDTMVMCPLFYNTLPPLPQRCHRQDQATTTIHEMTHCEGLYSPHTNDYSYGYNESVALPPERMVLNADNYSLYANGE
ncbi:hypothetical protein AAE478_002652 [Parahypoxylon ruwenzoriense]